MGPEGDFMVRRRAALCVLAVVLCIGILPAAAASGGLTSITPGDLKEWPDYHANTDEVSKIEFGKLTRVTQLVYETGVRIANLDHSPARDNRGPRAGKGTR
jgi:hypothetical protein